ncbi:hypothetical protein OG588_30935 [Streptomyces prunicolor]|uniref:hypothetical protein n=1 Tax=Streptomyces prunicolor TaxID=67348 RepID=UPI00386865A8|nr:hypothetical protein OG588_30935 [Streptomyces prunicolor]
MAYGKDGARTSRARLWFGLLAVVIGCYLAGDAGQRARVALEFGARWWPWALLGLAVVNLLRSMLPNGSLIGPLLLMAVAAAGLSTSSNVGTATVTNLALPGLLTLGGTVLVVASSGPEQKSSWSSVLTTGRVVIPQDTGRTVTVRAVLGELRADLTSTTEESRTVIHVTAIAGHVRVTVPRERWVKVHSSGTVLTHIAETGQKAAEVLDPSAGFTIHVLGMCSVVGIVRV